ncbi:MAG: endonuclease/exonuclease/phosphatase family protein [Planctomycetota bacterium]|nr:endonuclease/exonuclease/phosphatase family protein [Planctomycetota bacterium]
MMRQKLTFHQWVSFFRRTAWAYLGAGRRAPRRHEIPHGPSIKVITYNLNYDLPAAGRTIRAIQEANADVVCLQETNPQWEKLLRNALGERYSEMFFQHRGKASGMAMLSKLPTRQVPLTSRSCRCPAQLVEVDSPLGKIQFLNVHLTPPGNAAGRLTPTAFIATLKVRLDEIQELFQYLHAGVAAVAAGDFNEGDWGLAVGWLHRRGLTDALGQFDRHGSTWRMVMYGLLTLRDRLDHIFYSPHLDCPSAKVLRAGGSDHLPVVTVLRDAKR